MPLNQSDRPAAAAEKSCPNDRRRLGYLEINPPQHSIKQREKSGLVPRRRAVAAAANIVPGMVVATPTKPWSWCPVRSLLLRSAWFAGQDFVGTRVGTAAGPSESSHELSKWVICPTGKSPICLSSPSDKNIPVLFSPKSLLHPPPSRPARGAFRDRHGRWVRDAMDAACQKTNDTGADGEVVWS